MQCQPQSAHAWLEQRLAKADRRAEVGGVGISGRAVGGSARMPARGGVGFEFGLMAES